MELAAEWKQTALWIARSLAIKCWVLDTHNSGSNERSNWTIKADTGTGERGQ